MKRRTTKKLTTIKRSTTTKSKRTTKRIEPESVSLRRKVESTTTITRNALIVRTYPPYFYVKYAIFLVILIATIIAIYNICQLEIEDLLFIN